MKYTTLFCLISLLILASNAQGLNSGKEYFYSQRYTSAANEFQQIVASDPKNEEGIYWLGQTLLRQNDSIAAKALYLNALSMNGKSPWLLVGAGHSALMDGQTDSARRYFESALANIDGKSPDIHHAIARANIDAQKGDANYAVATLEAIPKRRRKELKNADTYLLMGQAYRKLINGGEAVKALRQALTLNPQLAEARYQIGKVYLTQNNPEFFLPAFEEAVQSDAKYAPAMYELFYYWFEKDINKARVYFDKYLAVSDKDASSQYDKISIIYASRDYQTAIDSAKNKIAALGKNADPRYYKLIAYSYEALKDSVHAKEYISSYFEKQKSDQFVTQDYVFMAKTMSKFPGNEAAVNDNFIKAVNIDTSKNGKADIMRQAADFASRSGNFQLYADWLGQIYKSDTTPSNRSVYDWGYAHYKAGNFVTADSIFCGIYTQKFPDEIFGYLWCARAAGAQDTSMEKGIAVEPYKRLIAFARASGEREDYKATLIQAHGYLASYYANVQKEKDSAVVYLQNILKLDPENASASQYIDILTKPTPEPAPASKSTKRSRQKTPAKKPNKIS